MNLLHASSLLRLWRRLIARRRPARPVYTVTVPAPLARAEVVALRPALPARPPLPRVVNG
jgi:hypothetical protein